MELLKKEQVFFKEAKKIKDSIFNDSIKKKKGDEVSYFAIHNDSFITSYLNSLNTINSAPSVFMDSLLSVKYEELLIYLIGKYGEVFESYLCSLISKKPSAFQETVEKNIYTSLTLEEISFLCNMSLSTFKRNFIKAYAVSPGKWLRDKRLLKAKELLEEGSLKSSDIYLNLGYNNLSNFSVAFKNKFGISPKDVDVLV